MSTKFAQLLIKENTKKILTNKKTVKNQPKSIKVDWRTDKKKRLNNKDNWISKLSK